METEGEAPLVRILCAPPLPQPACTSLHHNSPHCSYLHTTTHPRHAPPATRPPTEPAGTTTGLTGAVTRECGPAGKRRGAKTTPQIARTQNPAYIHTPPHKPRTPTIQHKVLRAPPNKVLRAPPNKVLRAPTTKSFGHPNLRPPGKSSRHHKSPHRPASRGAAHNTPYAAHNTTIHPQPKKQKPIPVRRPSLS